MYLRTGLQRKRMQIRKEVIEEVHANKNEDIIYLNIIKNQQKRTS
jgi:hypothetical protein